MTVRVWLRKIVGSGDHLGPVRLGLLRVIDPIEWYMRKFDEDRQRSQRNGRMGDKAEWVAYAALEPRHSMAGEDEPTIDPPKPPGDADETLDEHLKRREVLLKDQRPYLEEKARDLLQGRDAFIHTTSGTIRARFVRFRNGAVFEHWHSGDDSYGHGMSRIDRPHLSDAVGELVGYLADVTFVMD